MAEGGWGSGTWGEAGWGMSVYYRDTSDTATASESEVVAGSTLSGAVNETAEGIDFVAPFHNFFSGVEDGASVSDATLVAPSTLVVSMSEAATASEANSVQQVFATAVSETAVAGINSPFLNEFTAQQVFATLISETATGAEVLDADFAYFVSVSEIATASEINSAQHVMPVSVSEGITVADSAPVAQQIFDTRIEETATASELDLVAGSIWYVYMVAGATIGDQLTARYLWEPIDDNQDANWQNINDGQTPAWSAISGNQTPSWTPVQTA